jgi:hypothetical protein
VGNPTDLAFCPDYRKEMVHQGFDEFGFGWLHK